MLADNMIADAQHIRGLCNEIVDNHLCKMEQLFYPNTSSSNVPLSVSLGTIDILCDNGAGYREGLHNYDHIRAAPSDDILITLPLACRVYQVQAGRIADLSKGSFAILSTMRPFRTRTSRPTSLTLPLSIMARVSATFLREKFARIDDSFGIPIKLRPGAGSITEALFNVALVEGQTLPHDQRQYLGRMLVDAIGESLSCAPEVAHLKLPRAHATTLDLCEQAKSYILGNLANADLGVEAVANHCRVSTRHLRSVFARHESRTVVSFICDERLARCRNDLANPALADKPVANVAINWGFGDAGYFSKLYKRRFGNLPSQDRRR